MAAQDQGTPFGDREVHIKHLDRSALVEDSRWRRPRCQRSHTELPETLRPLSHQGGMKAIIFTTDAAKDLAKLPLDIRANLEEAIDHYAMTGYGDVTSLKGATATGSMSGGTASFLMNVLRRSWQSTLDRARLLPAAGIEESDETTNFQNANRR